jgi:hypothetical protein
MLARTQPAALSETGERRCLLPAELSRVERLLDILDTLDTADLADLDAEIATAQERLEQLRQVRGLIGPRQSPAGPAANGAAEPKPVRHTAASQAKRKKIAAALAERDRVTPIVALARDLGMPASSLRSLAVPHPWFTLTDQGLLLTPQGRQEAVDD